MAAPAGVLFVSHDSSRSGAPIALLNFLRWFKKNSTRPFSILLPNDGELTPDFRELAETWSIDRSRWCPGSLWTSVLNRLGLGAAALRAETADILTFARRCSPGLIYANSIASAPIIDRLAPLRAPVLTHVHELEYVFAERSGPALSALLERTRTFIACSNVVREKLLSQFRIPPEGVETIHESISVDEVRAERTREQVLRELQLPSNALTVLGAGAQYWRKGADLFVQLARMVCHQRSDVYFIWIGGLSEDIARLEYDVRLAGLANHVRITGVVPKPADYFSAGDVFVLTSREDPYPLVCLEAAALGKPIVCFESGGGMPEFVENNCGFVVPYLDLIAMVDRTMFLLSTPEARLKMGTAARGKVAQRHDVSVAGPRIVQLIERTIRRSAL